jgi:hypothetical protein
MNLMKKGRAKSGRIVAQEAEVYKRDRRRGTVQESFKVSLRRAVDFPFTICRLPFVIVRVALHHNDK